MGNIKSLLKNEYLFSIITKFGMVFLGLAESALLARYLGAAMRGELAYIYSICSTCYLLLTFGVYTAYPFLRKQGQKDAICLQNEFLSIVSTLFLVYSLFCFTTSIIEYEDNRSLSYILLLIPLMGYDKIISFVFMIENPNRTNLVSLVVNILQCAYLLFLFIFSSSPYLFAGIIFYIIGCLSRIVYFLYKLSFKFSVDYFDFKSLWYYIKFGFYPMLALLLTTLNYRLDIIMLKQYSYIPMVQIGIYSIGMGLSEKCLLIPDALKEVLLSKLAKGKSEEEVAKVMRICFAASLVTAVFIQMIGGLVINVIYGEEYRGAESVTYIAVWGATSMVFFKMISQYNVVNHKQHMNVIFLSVSIAINFIANLFLIPICGIGGAAISTVCGYLSSSIIFILFFRKCSGIPIWKMIFIQKNDIYNICKLIK